MLSEYSNHMLDLLVQIEDHDIPEAVLMEVFGFKRLTGSDVPSHLRHNGSIEQEQEQEIYCGYFDGKAHTFCKQCGDLPDYVNDMNEIQMAEREFLWGKPPLQDRYIATIIELLNRQVHEYLGCQRSFAIMLSPPKLRALALIQTARDLDQAKKDRSLELFYEPT